MTPSEKRRLRLLRVTGAIALSLYRAVLYTLSFLGPVLIIHHFRYLPVTVLLVLSVIGFGVAGFVFLLLLVLTKKCLIGRLEHTGVETIDSNYAKRWFSAAMLVGLVDHSPFRSMVTGLSLFASWFYRGMGARMPSSVLLGGRAWIFDPWFLEVGENVNIGSDAVILGHLGHGREIILGRVIIGDRAIIGMRATIFPDVRIGSDARVAAGALVPLGTVIADGETWAGVPARKIAARTAAGAR